MRIAKYKLHLSCMYCLTAQYFKAKANFMCVSVVAPTQNEKKNVSYSVVCRFRCPFSFFFLLSFCFILHYTNGTAAQTYDTHIYTCIDKQVLYIWLRIPIAIIRKWNMKNEIIMCRDGWRQERFF